MAQIPGSDQTSVDRWSDVKLVASGQEAPCQICGAPTQGIVCEKCSRQQLGQLFFKQFKSNSIATGGLQTFETQLEMIDKYKLNKVVNWRKRGALNPSSGESRAQG